MEENKKYNFKNGLSCNQEELTLLQDIEITKLLSKIDINSLADTKIFDLINLITKESFLPVFLNIILQGNEISEDKLLSLKNSELKEIIEDFFTLNPLVKDALGIFKVVADTVAQMKTLPHSEPNASDIARNS